MISTTVSASPALSAGASPFTSPARTSTRKATPTHSCPVGYSSCTPFFSGRCMAGYTTSVCGACVPVSPTKSPHATGSPTKSSAPSRSSTMSGASTHSPTKSGASTRSRTASGSLHPTPTRSAKATLTPTRTPTHHGLRELVAATSHTRTPAATHSRSTVAASRAPTPSAGCGVGQYAIGAGCGDCPPGYAACSVTYSGACAQGYTAAASTPGAPGFPGLTCGACVPATPSPTCTKPPATRSPSSHATGSATHTRASTGSGTHTRSASKPVALPSPSRSGTRAATPSKTVRPT